MNYTKTFTKTDTSVEEILNDYRLACESRQVSIIGRKEVFMGKAKFGIFGDGKELAQIAMAKAFRKGDFRVGYYRDQTFMFAIGELTYQQFFAQLYAHTDVEAEPSSAGRLMNSHFANRFIEEDGRWKRLTDHHNCAADISPTAAQIPRLVGLGLASKYYRKNPELKRYKNFSINGNEVAFGTIGNAATSEGIFLEAVNAMGVLQIPVLLSVWDDGYGISVPNKYQTTKGDISKALEGFQRTDKEQGLEIFRVPGWDYETLVETYKTAAGLSRKEHVPSFVHVYDLTQPQGHSTSGSHERYKTEERLNWEREFDCIKKMREWMLDNELAYPDQLDAIEADAVQVIKQAKEAAWMAYLDTVKGTQRKACKLIEQAIKESNQKEALKALYRKLKSKNPPLYLDAVISIKKALRLIGSEEIRTRGQMQVWLKDFIETTKDKYSSHLYSETSLSALQVREIKPKFSENSRTVDGREVVQACFDAAFSKDPLVVAFGEDLGKIGDVNQGFAGLQEKYGEIRITDTGIRETTIIGQGIGLAMRGFRPIAEIQYLDYLIFALQTLTDDLATLRYRTKSGQKAPLIIRTRGHRLEGVWHSGSPMGMILHSIRGIYLLVPRNMTQAAGFYNTMLQSDDPALIIECLNGYRLKEKLPDNIGEFTLPLGVPEILKQGSDITIVTYGAMCRIVMEAAQQLESIGISCEVIDVQTLLPFDLHHIILKSLKKTNRIIFADEDVPGGASAYMLQKVLEDEKGYQYLDSAPATLTSMEHRPAYGSDGDYFSKPNVENVYDLAYRIMSEADPKRFPDIF
ncbi:MAG: alpha-ketoacid dehydrogenase subunit alpha/beta [Candidatus Cyclobacteriaceae bacterium M3_2C_046]